MTVDLLGTKILVNLSSPRDEGGPCQTKTRVDLLSRDEGGLFGNKKIPWICHQVIRVYPLEQKILVDL
jgi:hypothetical protein